MDIDLKIGEHSCHSVGHFEYYHYTNGYERGIIKLFSFDCDLCGEYILDAEDYCHILEHEYIELFACSINREVSKKKWNAKGFNKAIRKAIPERIAFHVHGDMGCQIKYG